MDCRTHHLPAPTFTVKIPTSQWRDSSMSLHRRGFKRDAFKADHMRETHMNVHMVNKWLKGTGNFHICAKTP